MKKIMIMLVLVVIACTNITAQNFERAVPENARDGKVEGYIDHATGLCIEKRYNRISSIYNSLVWVEVYDAFVVAYVKKADGWQQTVEPIDRLSGKSQIVAMGVVINGLNGYYDNVKVKVSIGPQRTQISFMKPGMTSKNYSIAIPDFMKYKEPTYPRRRHNPHPGKIY